VVRDVQDLSVRTSVIRVALLILLAVSMVGCSLIPRAKSSVDTPIKDLSELHDWQASGRIAVSGVSSGGSGSFTWVQRGGESQVHLRGPIGIGNLQLRFDEKAMRIDTGDGQTFEAEAAQAEFTSRLGAQIPTQNLRYWMRGIPAPGEFEWQQKSLGVDGAVLLQNEWKIEYQRFEPYSEVQLPSKLLATSGPVKVRILIDRWKAL
jgi:outer membrane lipoprotein LolB